MTQLFIFLDEDGHAASVCETAFAAAREEAYLTSRNRLVDMVSVIAPSLEECWATPIQYLDAY